MGDPGDRAQKQSLRLGGTAMTKSGQNSQEVGGGAQPSAQRRNGIFSLPRVRRQVQDLNVKNATLNFFIKEV